MALLPECLVALRDCRLISRINQAKRHRQSAFQPQGRTSAVNWQDSFWASNIGSKNWLFLGNAESGGKCAILYTIVENCRRLGINTREYLEDVLTRLPAMKAQEAKSLTPHNWLLERTRRAKNPAA